MEEHILWQDNSLILLDQRTLPLKKERVTCRNSKEVAAAIKAMVVRGAPAIGIAAAYGMVLASLEADREPGPCSSTGELDRIINTAALELEKARPTAVNLAWAISRMLNRYHEVRGRTVAEIQTALLAEARAIKEEDLQNNHAIGRHGLTLLQRDMNVLTYCNAGGLATAGY
ncbi:MAG TPA: S-methyl-5-thioribose-1-phosphate isomerase, partial [Firmicutes bacterium]|nr:S-methyl-5-thioribose-1-phosphate isomerase [Bacillota bacterium]